MPIAQVRNASMQELGSVDHLTTDNKNFGAEWYDSVGGTAFISATVVPLAGELVNSAPTVFDMDSSILTITEAGLYLFLYAVSASNPGSAEMVIESHLEEDPDSGVFSTVIGTTSYATYLSGWGTVFNSSLLRVGIDYRYRLMASRPGGSASPTFIQNQSKLSVVRLFKNG